MIFVIPLLGILAFGITISSNAETWDIYHLNATISGNNFHFKIPYNTINSKLGSITLDAQSLSLLIYVKNVTDLAILNISVPRDLVDAKIPGGADDMFFVLIDGQEIKYKQVNAWACFRTLAIPIDPSSKVVEIIGSGGSMDYPADMWFSKSVKPVYISIGKSNFDSYQASGCTDLKLDDKQMVLNITNLQTGKNTILFITPDINGTFSEPISVGDLGGNGKYTVSATYAGQSATQTVEVIPEFPTGVVVLLISISFLIIISSRPRFIF